MRIEFAAALVLVVGCGGASADSGINAAFRIENAQYIPGEIDTTSPDGDTTDALLPMVHTVTTINGTIVPGTTGHTLAGTLGPGSTAVLIGLSGDIGHWVVPVSTVDQQTPGDFAFSAKATFGYNLPPPPLKIVLRATNRAGEMGPSNTQIFGLVKPPAPGAMVVSLEWDTEADLDLHVQLPTQGADGGFREISTRKLTSLVPPAPGDPGPTPEDIQNAAYLDMDSNAQCVIDGRRNENVIWPITPETGLYVVRVDTFSMCGEVAANWRVRVFINGDEQTALGGTGQSMDVDTRFSHGTGAGVQAASFDYQP
jgi:hypothetical protein